jgi:periplasmic protein TonB
MGGPPARRIERLLPAPILDLAPRRASAWTASLAIHCAALVAAFLWMGKTLVVSPPKQTRLVFIEPLAPPPAVLPSSKNAAVPARPRKPVVRPKRLVLPRKAKELPAPIAEPPARAAPRPKEQRAAVEKGKVGSSPGGGPGAEERAPFLEGPIPAAEVAEVPVVISRVLPDYPPLARARGLEGYVVLKAVIDPNGRVEPGVILERSDPSFNAAAIAALRQWRFQPGKDRDGHPVRVLIEIPIRFRLR